MPSFLPQLAITAIERAETAIRHHEARYRTPLERIAGWRYNPTVRLLALRKIFLMRLEPHGARAGSGRSGGGRRCTATRTCGR